MGGREGGVKGVAEVGLGQRLKWEAPVGLVGQVATGSLQCLPSVLLKVIVHIGAPEATTRGRGSREDSCFADRRTKKAFFENPIVQ